jgi:hypothetical protein
MDTQFGLKFEGWDQNATTKEEMAGILAQYAAMRLEPKGWVLLCVDWRNTAPMVEALQEAYYTDIQPIFWYKDNQNEAGDPGRFTHAVEVFIIGFKYDGAKSSVYRNLDKNPLKRHNLMIVPTLHKYFKDEEGNKINMHQKPAGCLQWFLDRFAQPNSTIVIVGSGSGSEAIGACQWGCNVVAVESDARQADWFSRHLTTTSYEHEDAKVEEEPPKSTEELVAKVANTIETRDVCSFCGFMKDGDLVTCFHCRRLRCQDHALVLVIRDWMSKPVEGEHACFECHEECPTLAQRKLDRAAERKEEEQKEAILALTKSVGAFFFFFFLQEGHLLNNIGTRSSPRNRDIKIDPLHTHTHNPGTRTHHSA